MKNIILDTAKVRNMKNLFDCFAEWSQKVGSESPPENLDALEEMLRDTEHTVTPDDI